MRKRNLAVLLTLAITLSLVTPLIAQQRVQAPAADRNDRIVRGFQIAPVHLTLRNRDRNLVGLGSYLVNAVAGCNDCHTSPPYAAGGDPFQGEPKRINTAGYLAGGVAFGPVVSRNITPDSHGLPAGLTLAEFKQVMRTGHDPDEPDHILQVMPWPVYQNMTDDDLRAIYEYLRSIPHID